LRRPPVHEDSIVMARPEAPSQLVLLFHGVGSSAANLVPLGRAIAQARQDAMVDSVDAPHPSTLGSGRSRECHRAGRTLCPNCPPCAARAAASPDTRRPGRCGADQFLPPGVAGA
jgi:hypothetical protein